MTLRSQICHASPCVLMSSILRIILTSWVARLICCFLPINVSITCCSFISVKNQGHLNHWDNLKVISIRCGELEGGDYIQSECLFGIRELKQWRQRPGRKRLVKKWIYIILHLSRCLVRLSSSELAQAKCNTSVEIQMEIRKNRRWRSHSSKYAELNDFPLLFCKGWQRHVERFKTHVQNHSAH